MQTDEEEIRQLASTWMSASKAGDIDTVLSLMTDDVLFLIPGRLPMQKDEFAKLSRIPEGQPAPKIEGKSEIQEIQVSGDLAYMWTKLSIVMTPPGGSAPIERAGTTLSVLKRVNGKWLLARDANLLTQVQRATTG